MSAFKRNHPNGKYAELSSDERQDIRQACTREQFYLCAYCCQSITGKKDDTMNEHVEAQSLAPNRTLDFSNIIASCKTPRQCDASHKSQPLPITPLMPECEAELRFKLSGRVEGLSENAKEVIRVLNLGDTEENNKALIEKRKQLVATLIWSSYGDPMQLKIEDDVALIQMIIDDLKQPIDGKLGAFSPVLVNILSNW
nr:retron system putative HNH endonuclease [Undibacterium sp. 14-3-2]